MQESHTANVFKYMLNEFNLLWKFDVFVPEKAKTISFVIELIHTNVTMLYIYCLG